MENNNYSMEMYKGYTIKIEFDTDPENPIKEWDMLGTFACFHRDYDLSNTKQFSDSDDLQDFLKENENISLPLYLYDHSGITISTGPFSCQWDSGQVGIIFVTLEKIREEYKCKRITKKIREQVLNTLECEVKTFDDYLVGNVYGFTIEDSEGNHIDSCWGFYGYEGIKDMISECKGTIDYYRKEKAKKIREERKTQAEADKFYLNCFAI
jgi:hypothetical protein